MRLFGSGTNSGGLTYFQRRGIKKVGGEFDIEKFPLMKLKAKPLEYKEGFFRRLFAFLIGYSIRFTNSFFVARKVKGMVYDEIHNSLVNTYADWPAEVYASVVATLTTLTLLSVPVILFAPWLYFVFSIVTVLVGLYVMEYTKVKSSGMDTELFDIISLWYVVSSSGIPIKEQVKTIYDILRVYKQINMKYGKLFPEYKMYNMFFDMYYDMEKRNFNEVIAFYNQLHKIHDKKLKFIMSRLHRAVRDGFDLSEILADEFRKIIEDEVKRIEMMGDIIELLTELYALVLMFYIGFMTIISFTISAMTGIYTLKLRIQPLVYQIPVLTIFSTVGMGAIVNYLKGKNMLNKNIVYPFYHKIVAVVALVLYFVMYLLVGRYSSVGFVLTHVLPVFVIAYPLYRVVHIRRSIGSLDRELSIRFQQVSSAIRSGYVLADAFDSAVTTKDPKKMDFNDVIYTYLSAYLSQGYTMRELLEKLIIRTPSEQFRRVLSIIALTEEKASNLAEFIDRLSESIEEKMKTIDLVDSKTQLIVVQVFLVTFANIIMLAYMLLMTVAPMPLIMQSLEKFGMVYVPEDANYGVIDTVTNVFAPWGETSQSKWGDYIDLATGFIMYLSLVSAVSTSVFMKMYYNLTLVETIGVFLITMMVEGFVAYYFVVKYTFNYDAFYNFLVKSRLISNQTISI